MKNGTDFELVDSYGEGTEYYRDRSYFFSGFQEPLAGGYLLRTFNDMKYDSLVAADDRDRWRCWVWVDRPMVVYLLWDHRTLSTVPLWVWNGGWDWVRALQQFTTDHSMGYFAVLRRIIVPGDTLILGHPMADDVPTPSMYIVIFKPIEGMDGVPREYRLGPVYPNPSSSAIRINFAIPDRSWVTLVVWDILGREVATPIDEVREPGSYTERWDLRDLRGVRLPPGVYLLFLRAGPFWRGSAKITVLR